MKRQKGNKIKKHIPIPRAKICFHIRRRVLLQTSAQWTSPEWVYTALLVSWILPHILSCIPSRHATLTEGHPQMWMPTEQIYTYPVIPTGEWPQLMTLSCQTTWPLACTRTCTHNHTLHLLCSLISCDLVVIGLNSSNHRVPALNINSRRLLWLLAT